MRTIPAFLLALLLSSAALVRAQRIEVTIPAHTALHGHLILIFARTGQPEPRFQLTENYHSAQGFGVDVPNLAPNQPIVIDAKTFGNPLPSLDDIQPGDYTIQAVFNIYEPFHPTSSNKTLWLPPDRGEGQHWFVKPGNPYSKPEKIHFDPKSGQTLHITLDQTLPPIAGTQSDPEVIAARQPASKWLRYMRFRSPALSKFWGRDVYLGAWILLPNGYDQHPNAHYPLIVFQDHYHPGFAPLPFVTSPPNPKSPRAKRLQAGYKFFQDWTSSHFPRVLMLYIQDPNPYYDDSYAVDSANVGPYGTAINKELIPVIEKKYRGIGQGWARATFGGSTGGWRAFATQVFYPDMYNGAYVACPDPVDFHAFQNIDLYTDTNAFHRTGPFTTIPMAGDRLPDGSIIAEMRGEFGYEHVLGTHGRSTENIAMWQAVFSPTGPDGYPAQFVNPLTGDINKKVIVYWNQHYDLTAILKRDWPTL
ncbi:MAG: alpha/beta hydrolase-fold protein, partial [Acidobacteriaceae bacterium]